MPRAQVKPIDVFKENSERQHKIELLSDRVNEDLRSKVSGKGLKDARAFVYPLAVADREISSIEIPKAEALPLDVLNRLLGKYHITAQNQAYDILSQKKKDILGGLEDKVVEKLALQKEVMELGQAEFGGLIDSYAHYRQYSQVGKILKEGTDTLTDDKKIKNKVRENIRRMPEELRETAYKIAAEGIAKMVEEEFKNKPAKLREAAIATARDIALRGFADESRYLAGINAMTKKAEADFKKYEKDNKTNLKKYVSASVGKLLDDNVSSKQFADGANLLYSALAE